MNAEALVHPGYETSAGQTFHNMQLDGEVKNLIVGETHDAMEAAEESKVVRVFHLMPRLLQLLSVKDEPLLGVAEVEELQLMEVVLGVANPDHLQQLRMDSTTRGVKSAFGQPKPMCIIVGGVYAQN